MVGADIAGVAGRAAGKAARTGRGLAHRLMFSRESAPEKGMG